MFSKEELSFLLKKNPEAITIGTCQSDLINISRDVKTLTQQRGMELIKASTPEAVKKFNELIEKGKGAVAFIHVAC